MSEPIVVGGRECEFYRAIVGPGRRWYISTDDDSYLWTDGEWHPDFPLDTWATRDDAETFARSVARHEVQSNDDMKSPADWDKMLDELESRPLSEIIKELKASGVDTEAFGKRIKDTVEAAYAKARSLAEQPAALAPGCYHCMNCGMIVDIADGDELPRDDEHCSHEFEKPAPAAAGELPDDDLAESERIWLRSRKWEMAMSDEDGCETWQFPFSLRESHWPADTVYRFGNQYWWDREDAVAFQKGLEQDATKLALFHPQQEVERLRREVGTVQEANARHSLCIEKLKDAELEVARLMELIKCPQCNRVAIVERENATLRQQLTTATRERDEALSLTNKANLDLSRICKVAADHGWNVENPKAVWDFFESQLTTTLSQLAAAMEALKKADALFLEVYSNAQKVPWQDIEAWGKAGLKVTEAALSPQEAKVKP